ncbi:MAG: elongation factor P [Planctomycetota bacterium]
MKANELRPGIAVNLDGRVLVVIKTDHVKPGKGPAYVQAKMRDIKGTGTVEKRFSSSDNIDGATLDRREMEFLYESGDMFTFMDMEDYDQIEIPAELVGNDKHYLTPNLKLIIMFHDGKPVTLELPGSVEVEITDTPPGIKGATVTNQLKEAECDTGLKTRVPPFIEVGEKVKVNTSDGSYISRAKE